MILYNFRPSSALAERQFDMHMCVFTFQMHFHIDSRLLQLIFVCLSVMQFIEEICFKPVEIFGYISKKTVKAQKQ